MSKFIGLIVGGLEIAAGVLIATFIGPVPVAGLLISAGIGTIVSGVGSLISSALAGSPGSSGITSGITTASINPIKPWDIVYGRQAVGGTLVYEHSFGDHEKYSDFVIVLAAHQCQSVDALLFDKQLVQMSTAGGPFTGIGDSFSPLQQTVGIFHISRSNDVVTVVLHANIPLLVPGDFVRISGITGDYTLNGRYPVAQIISQISGTPGSITFSYISGGVPSIVDLEGTVDTQWADYGRKIHMEVLLGNHTGIFPGMASGTANDGDTSDLIVCPDNPWDASHLIKGKTSVFLRLHYADKIFAGGIPKISFLIHGKNDIMDPRTSPPTIGYTENGALCIADYLANKAYGYGAAYGTEIPIPQLIAAANICDEPVPLAAGGTEPRYTCNGRFDLSLLRGRILENMLTCCGGRLNTAAGQFVIQPAAWYGSTPFPAPSVGQMSGPYRWSLPGVRDLYNGVKGTYISPANNWQPGDIPPYTQDSTHGYTTGIAWSSSVAFTAGETTVYNKTGYIALLSSTNKRPDTNPTYWAEHYQDINLSQDGGERRWKDIQLPFTISAAMAQRICSIELRRLRQFQTATFRYNMAGYKITVLDVVQITVTYLNWVAKNVEVLAHRFTFTEQATEGGNAVVLLGTEIDVQETDASVYDWSPTEELTPQGYKQATIPSQFQPAAPTSFALRSDYSTVVKIKGSLQDTILASWIAPADGYVTNGGHIEIQYQVFSSPLGPWIGLPSVNSSVTQVTISPVTNGTQYQAQIRSVNAGGVPSDWITAGPITASGARGPLALQAGVETPVISDVLTQDLSFGLLLDYTGPDANGNYTPQVEIQAYWPVNTLGIAPAPDVSAVIVTQIPTTADVHPGSYIAAIQAYDDTDLTNPGSSPMSALIPFTVPAGSVHNKVTLTGFTFGAHTQGYRLLVGLASAGLPGLTVNDIVRNCGGTLPTSLVIRTLPAPRSLGPSDIEADHPHVQGFAVKNNGGIWALSTDGPLVGSIVHLPDAVGFTADQFAGYMVEQLPGGTGAGYATPIAHGVIQTHDAAGNFTIQDSTGWVLNAGDLILCRFKLATATANSFSDPNIVNPIYPSGNTDDDAGMQVWVLERGTVQQIQTVASNTTTSFTIVDEFDPPITTSSQIIIVYPTAIYDAVGPAVVSTNDLATSSIPTIATVPIQNFDGDVIAIRVFTESADSLVDPTEAPMRMLYVQGKPATIPPFSIVASF